jgi:hypothetical protein
MPKAGVLTGLLVAGTLIGFAQVKTAPPKGKTPSVVLAPIQVNDVHDGDQTVSGYSPVLGVALSVKLNGESGVSTANPNASGLFAIALPASAQAGNFVEISATTASGTPIYGKKTVLPANVASAPAATAKAAPAVMTTPAAPAANHPQRAPAPVAKDTDPKPADANTASLSKPSISTPAAGAKTITVTLASDDQGKASLIMHVEGDAGKYTCTPDDATHACTVKLPHHRTLDQYQTVQAYVSSPDIAAGPTAVAVVPAITLNAPAIQAVDEGAQAITVTRNSSDTQAGLLLQVSGQGSEKAAYKCTPDDLTNSCTIPLKYALRTGQTIQAQETFNSFAGPSATSTVGVHNAFGVPSIAPPRENDKSIKITLDHGDYEKWSGNLSVYAEVFTGNDPVVSQSCTPNSMQDWCAITVDTPLVAGQVIHAREVPGNSTMTNPPAMNTGATNPSATNGTTPGSATTPTAAAKPTKPPASKKSPKGAAAGKPGATTPSAGQPDPGASTPPDANTAGDNGDDIPNVTQPAVTPAPALPTEAGAEALATVQEIGYDWGRVRAYFSLGAIFSRYTTSTPSTSASTTNTGSTTMTGTGSSTTTSTPTTTATNFSSPDVFAGLDMDFNWYTTQKCLAYPFGHEQVKLATLLAAVIRCGKFSKSNRPQNAGITNAMKHTRDAALLSLLEFVSRLKFDDDKTATNLPSRLIDIHERIDAFYDPQPQADPEVDKKSKKNQDKPKLDKKPKGTQDDLELDAYGAITELAGLKLTPFEGQQILNQFGFEDRPHWGFLINSYFLTRLTQTSASNGFTLVNSSNSVHVEGGIYTPFYFPWSRWTYKHNPNALFLAPIAKLGFDSLRGSATDQLLQSAAVAAGSQTPAQQNYQNAASALSRDIYRMMAFGTRLGVFTLSPTPHRAPELISYIDFTYGRFDNYFVPVYGSTTGMVHFPWRFDITGRLQIPSTPFYVGLDLNKGTGPDNLSIFIGARTDLSNMLGKLIPTAQ